MLLLEDAAYRELTYHGTVPPSLKALDPDNTLVAQCQTFSKPFAPGLKLGYALLPGDLVDPVLQQKGNHDFGGANLTHHLALRALQSGAYDRQVARIRAAYGRKLRAVLDALDATLGGVGGVGWTRPTGGLYVWVTLPAGVDAGRDGPLFADCVRRGVMYVPGAYARLGAAPPRHELRLSGATCRRAWMGSRVLGGHAPVRTRRRRAPCGRRRPAEGTPSRERDRPRRRPGR